MVLIFIYRSRYYKNFADDAKIWEVRLVTLDEVLLLLNPIQRKWVYLEPIFGRGALPQEQARFRRIDQEFKGIMQSIEADPRVVSLASQTNLVETLQVMRASKMYVNISHAWFLNDRLYGSRPYVRVHVVGFRGTANRNSGRGSVNRSATAQHPTHL